VSPEALRSLESAHAIVAWLATAALVATASLVTLRAGARRVWIAAGAAVALVITASGLGLALHDPYRARLRQRLFVQAPALGWLFERKLSAAFAATLLAVGGLALLAGLARDERAARELRRSALLAWSAAAALSVFASIASAIVARRAHF
jgi:hypothetical protein